MEIKEAVEALYTYQHIEGTYVGDAINTCRDYAEIMITPLSKDEDVVRYMVDASDYEGFGLQLDATQVAALNRLLRRLKVPVNGDAGYKSFMEGS